MITGRPASFARPAAALVLLACAAAFIGCQRADVDNGGDPPARPTDPAVAAYANSVDAPPPGWSGPVFELSHDYPAEAPGPCSDADCPWLGLTSPASFEADFDSSRAPGAWENSIWPEWMETVKAVIREGQDPNLTNEAGFQTSVNGETVWFHVPWMAYDTTAGREFVHGTTNERTSHLSDLLGGNSPHRLPASVQMVGAGLTSGTDETVVSASDCEELNVAGFETWAVGVYNTYGGYALGQTFGADGRPRIGQVDGRPVPAGLPFPTGTLVTKFLFTTAPVSCVPYLEGAPEWTVNRHVESPDDSSFTTRREPQTVRLVQVDVAAVDPDSPTRWIYGTFAYNGYLDGATIWDRLQPVGIQWGSDPATFPGVPRAESQPATQGVLNVAMTSGPTGIYEHFGCEGRLAGPVDNGKSSCMSCHASAYAAADGAISSMGSNVPASFGFPGLCDQFSEENEDYFQNNIFPAAYSGGQYPTTMNLDTSMQMWVAFQQYGTYNTDGEPEACTMGS